MAEKLTQAEKVEAVHDYLFTPPMQGGKTRAEKIDVILDAVSSGGTTARWMLWLLGGVAGGIVTLSSVIQVIKGWGGQP